MSEKDTLININEENSNQDDAKVKRLLLFKIVRKVMTCYNRQEINSKKFHQLKEKYEILKTLEIETPVLKEVLRTALLNRFYQECESDDSDLLFFAAATFNLDKLQEIVGKCHDKSILNESRYSDSVIVFTLKYGNIANPNFLNCMNILVDAGVGINKPDFNGRFAIDIAVDLYYKHKDENLKNLIIRLVEKGICNELVDKKTEYFITQTLNEGIPQAPINQQNKDLELIKIKLFSWIGKENIHNIYKCPRIKDLVNSDNGEHTLLQFACKKSKKMHLVVKFLLEKGADPNKVTKLNKYTPLELAARKNHQSSVQELLQNDNLKITQTQFNNFVKWRSNCVKLKIFEMFLESDKLDPNFTYEKTGNTPLHYATRFSHKQAIQKILKRPETSLLAQNNTGKTALDLINVSDLKIYFNSCLALDRHAPDFSCSDYKMLFRFKSLVSKRNQCIDETEVLSKISQNKQLESVLAHPLLHTFIELKWYKVRWYYIIILLLQGILFSLTSLSFYHLHDTSKNVLGFCIFFTLINFFSKFMLMFDSGFSIKLRFPTLYEACEALLMLTLLGSFFAVEFCAFAFIEMSIIFLLTAGYHLKIAKWPVMVINVFQSFILLMLFFSIILVAFAAGFHLLFKQKNSEMFKTFWKSTFLTYIMITGEFNIADMNFGTTNFLGYFLFFLFAIFIAVITINFWIGVAVSDIRTVENNAEINAFKNVITFLVFVEKRVYGNKIFRRCRINPYLFPLKEKKNYQVDFYINKKNQFEGRSGFMRKVGKNCMDKIKSFCSKQEKVVGKASKK